MNLHETAMGQRFFNVQLPALINTLKDIAAALSRPAPSAISFPADQHFLTSLYYGEYEADVFKPDKRLAPFNQAVQQKEKALLPLLSNEASIAFEQYQAAVQCRNSTVLEQAYASGYRTAVQMFAAGLGPQPPVPEHGEDIAILAVTAAIAEEIGRYIAFRFFVKGQSAQNTPLYFGLGHGGIEALSVGVNSVILLVCSPYTLINMGSDVALAGIERISTLLAQIAFSYIVFCSYQKKTYRYLILAICLHSMYDFPLVLLDYSVSPFIFEIGLFLFSAILLLFTLKGVRGIHSNEKNN